MTSLHSIQDLSQANLPPSDVNQGLLQNFFTSDRHTQIEAINNKISELEEQLHALYDERTRLVNTFKPCKKSLSPFQRIPEDIVREIFVACLPTRRYPSMANTEAPVLLTQICSAMRHIALTMPMLWAKIHIPIIGDVPEPCIDDAAAIMRKRAEGVREWLLRRSGTLPLDITIHAPFTHKEAQTILAREIIDILVACSARWRRLFLSCSPKFLAPIAALTPSDAPLLRAISFYAQIWRFNLVPEDENVWAGSTFLGGASLQQFILLGELRGHIYDYPVKWKNLTHTVLKGNANRIARILQQATCLTSCHLTIDGLVPNVIDEIRLPHLQVLVVDECSEVEQAGSQMLLALLHTPVLKAVSYNMDKDWTGISTALNTLLERSPTVQEFSIKVQELPFDGALECFHHLPLLSSLYIGGTFHADDWRKVDTFLLAFVVADAFECLCPKLAHFRCDSRLRLSQQTLHSFLARKNGTDPHLACWKEVTLTVEYDVGEKSIRNTAWSEIVGSDTKLTLDFVPHNTFVQALDQGVSSVFTGLEDEWWLSYKMTEPRA